MTTAVLRLDTVDDFRLRAEATLTAAVRDFVAGGSDSETTLAANRAALDRVTIVPRVLTGGPDPEPGATLAGARSALPLAVAPMAYQRLLHPEGELATARAAAAAGVPFVVSTLSSVPVGELAAAGGEQWFQLYWLNDDRDTMNLVHRAEDAGCRVLMVTVDVPVMGRRLRDIRNEFVLPAEVRAANVASGAMSAAHDRADAGSALIAHTNRAFHPALTWAHLEALRSRTTLPIVVKGILDPADARRAAEIGATGVVISNHGGRQLDGAPASVTMLPAAVAAVPDTCQVFVDSGIRSGTDILRALALGAHGVLIGRPMLWGLAAGGETGAAGVLAVLDAELRAAMRLAGCADVAAARRLTATTGC
ncbi:alpha-hydroxy acid oxidase [Actinoplanes teichomyceticus]|uniref:4-hydroxymandelate oxidase n=1 Tax=Actinoplanes teichomyceticus TaxID=1867 RepID=Q6ZZG4_ACTTI|nr:alpha-hydroxy acid oxidase [Actinoplanes teichomyceticus]TWG09449.1 4-hydroxymandelate oxidase [Actinoplanes teichomyceticus]GIF17138.1 alpha-hydroxy-acid oxidizing enzyme [Actinoplanes teichomyceticus]CAE53379.1 Hmo protein [Actinoplanes teichomyceticus]CAG15041.1 HmO protein [Actinoplanes teichomyceticus]